LVQLGYADGPNLDTVEYGVNIYLRSVERHPAAGTRLPRSAVRTVVLNGRVDDPGVTEQRR